MLILSNGISAVISSRRRPKEDLHRWLAEARPSRVERLLNFRHLDDAHGFVGYTRGQVCLSYLHRVVIINTRCIVSTIDSYHCGRLSRICASSATEFKDQIASRHELSRVETLKPKDCPGVGENPDLSSCYRSLNVAPSLVHPPVSIIRTKGAAGPR
jgi:hypothetical protein